MPETLVVGRIGRPHGLRGELAVSVRTDVPDERFATGVEFTVAAGRRLKVAGSRWHSGTLLLSFDGVGDRDTAAELTGTTLTVEASALAPIDDPDEFHDHELIGLRAELADGSVVGEVRDVLHGPAGELLVVTREARADALIPFVHQIVPTIDLAAGKVVLTPPEGLLEDELG
jgi:16S rRNA processing protein RimM